MHGTPPERDWFADILIHEPPPAPRATIVALLERGERPRDIYMDVLAPALVEVGLRWQRGEISVAQEHLASAEVASLMAFLAPLVNERPAVARTVVLAGTDASLHSLGMDMVRDFLAGDGWEVRPLGPATPTDDLVAFVDASRADVVGLSTTLTVHLAAAAEAIAALRALPRPPFVIVGGQAWGGDERLARQLGADAYAPDARAASRVLRECFPTPDEAVALRQELAARTTELEQAVRAKGAAERHVAALAGIVPVCVWCGRVRREIPSASDWLPVSAYLREAGLLVTESMCEACSRAVGAHLLADPPGPGTSVA